MRVMDRLGDDAPARESEGPPSELPVPALNYAPATDRKPRLSPAATVTLMICGALLVLAPVAAVVWACSAEYYNDSVNALALYALTSAAVGILMLIAAISRGATQRDAAS